VILLVVLVVLAIATALTWPRAAPNAGAPLLACAHIDPATMAILDRSCRDCHSDSTRYPWYSYVAPSSVLVWWDVSNGRRHMNWSNWQSYPVVRQERLLSEIANQVKDRDMPVPQYTVIHRNAVLSDAEIDQVFRWTQAERARLIAEASR